MTDVVILAYQSATDADGRTNRWSELL